MRKTVAAPTAMPAMAPVLNALSGCDVPVPVANGIALVGVRTTTLAFLVIRIFKSAA
jgi:hypothetical protein